MTCSVDDDVVQDDRTSDFAVDPVMLLASISRSMTLHPGDVVFAGATSAGDLDKSPRKLRAGQLLTTDIHGVGQLVNRVAVGQHRDVAT
jgi:2-keto-4-pentenoate hydratase/2-oxohepta-3-ene-1,7-dioic acid hydratase in catechol pathway